MTVGRKAIPTALKLIKGSDRHKSRNPAEPKPSVARPQPPAFLTKYAKEEWAIVIDELFALGIMTKIDRAALAAYCQAYGRWRDAEEQMADEELIFVTDRMNRIQNPLLGVANTAMGLMMKYAVEFGMTPAGRTRVRATPEEAKTDTSRFFD